MISPSEPIEATTGRHFVGPAERRGDDSGRLCWACPSSCVVPGESQYHCFGCGAHGDAIDASKPGMRFPVQAILGHLPKSPAPLTADIMGPFGATKSPRTLAVLRLATRGLMW
jgi:hypothetical protein